MEIKRITTDKLRPALNLVKQVFDAFEAPEYSQEGVEEFYRFISWDIIAPKIEAGEIILWGAYQDGAPAGVIALRGRNHICLFFVDGKFHHQGIGRLLYRDLTEYVKNIEKRDFVTVFSSPFAVRVYEALGFVRLAPEQLVNGMRCNPMAAYIF